MSKSHTKPHTTLIATLGTEPQVITSTLDLLIGRNEPIDQVIVIHTSAQDTSLSSAVDELHREFHSNPTLVDIPLSFHPIRNAGGQLVADVVSLEEVESAFRTLYQTVLEMKKQNHRVHLSIAGGRKSMAVYGMVTAQMLFDEEDRLWHLHSSGDFFSQEAYASWSC
jgi:CRISPR-associated Csx14 family protein